MFDICYTFVTFPKQSGNSKEGTWTILNLCYTFEMLFIENSTEGK